ncbi:hypothetical protein CR492_20225 [Methylocella silvestris]|uniref:Uncharacterized protein n=1 Tax=Methylocella silvestris TaxID=199596 RepID=A0A2J7TBM8_METSI|nr:hypothetical protein CR492_20225 [Methylocella silvestris]
MERFTAIGSMRWMTRRVWLPEDDQIRCPTQFGDLSAQVSKNIEPYSSWTGRSSVPAANRPRVESRLNCGCFLSVTVINFLSPRIGENLFSYDNGRQRVDPDVNHIDTLRLFDVRRHIGHR